MEGGKAVSVLLSSWSSKGCHLGSLPTRFEEEKLALVGSPLSWPSPVSPYLLPSGPPPPPRTVYVEGATGSSQEVPVSVSAGISCQDLDPVSTPSPLRWHQGRLSGGFQLRNSAHRRSGHPPPSPQTRCPFLPSSWTALPLQFQTSLGEGRDTFILGTHWAGGS